MSAIVIVKGKSITQHSLYYMHVINSCGAPSTCIPMYFACRARTIFIGRFNIRKHYSMIQYLLYSPEYTLIQAYQCLYHHNNIIVSL